MTTPTATSRAVRDMTVKAQFKDGIYYVTVKMGRDVLCRFETPQNIFEAALHVGGTFGATRHAHRELVEAGMEEWAPLTHRIAGAVFNVIEQIRLSMEPRKSRKTSGTEPNKKNKVRSMESISDAHQTEAGKIR